MSLVSSNSHFTNAYPTVNVLCSWTRKNRQINSDKKLDPNTPHSVQITITSSKDRHLAIAYKVADLIANSSNLHTFSINFHFADPSSFAVVANALGLHPTLKTISKLWMPFKDGCAESVKNMLVTTTSIQELNLFKNGNHSLRSQDVPAIAEGLRLNSTLTSLTLNFPGANGEFGYLLNALAENTTLRHLDAGFSRVHFSPSMDFSALRTNSTLQKLKLQHNAISGIGAAHFFEALTYNSGLQTLSLGGNLLSEMDADINAVIAESMGKFIANNTTLTDLDLYHCKISPMIEHIASNLLHNSTLTCLSLENTGLKKPGSTLSLCRSLQPHLKIQELNLFDSDLSGESARALGANLPFNNSLTHLNLGFCNLGSAEIGWITDGLSQYGNSLVKFQINHNPILPSGMERVYQTFRNSTTLITLDVSSTQMGDEGANSLKNLIRENRSIHLLRFWNNNFSAVTIPQIEQALSSNYALLGLGFSLDPDFTSFESIVQRNLGNVKRYDTLYRLIMKQFNNLRDIELEETTTLSTSSKRSVEEMSSSSSSSSQSAPSKAPRRQ